MILANFCVRNRPIKNLKIQLATAIALLTPLAHAELHVMVDQVGYETGSPKQALVLGTEQDHPQQFTVVDSETGKTVFTGDLRPAGKVYNWTGAWGGNYWTAD